MNAQRYFLAVLACLLFCAAAWSDEVRGVVLKTDPDKQTLTIEGRGKGVRKATLAIQITKETKILFGGKPARLTDLTAGKRVRVTYEARDNQRVAVRITALGLVQAAPAAPAAQAVPAARDGNTLSGTLQRIALTDREIVLISSGAGARGEVETTLLVPEDVRIVKDQKTVRLEDLTEGEQAVVVTEKKDGKLWARSIQVGVAPANKNAPQPQEQRIQKVRQVLKMIDMLLERLEKR
jgi:hypothetical protein